MFTFTDHNKENYKRILEGNLMKEIINIVLQQAGYFVIPYGYEVTLPSLLERLRGIKENETVKRIRKSPDLLVYDDDRKDLKLVEIFRFPSITLTPNATARVFAPRL